jgi:hypothetical protein
MDPLLLSAVAVGSVAAAATAIANWRLGRQTTNELEERRRDAEHAAARAAGMQVAGDRWWSTRDGRDVEVQFTHTAEPAVPGKHLGAIGHITCVAHHRATFSLESNDLISELGLDMRLGDSTLDPYLRVRGSDAGDVAALFSSSTARTLLREQLGDVGIPAGKVRLAEHGLAPEVVGLRLPRFRRLWLDDDGLHVEWNCNRLPDHTTTSLASFTVDFLVALAAALDASHLQQPHALAPAIAETAAAPEGSSVAVRPF